MHEKPRSVFTGAVDLYLNNRYVLAVSAALWCGVFGLSFGLIAASIFTAAQSTILLVGFLVGLGFASLGVASALKTKEQARRPKRDGYQVMATFIGASTIFSCAATVLGINDGWNLAVALVAAVGMSLWLSLTPR